MPELTPKDHLIAQLRRAADRGQGTRLTPSQVLMVLSAMIQTAPTDAERLAFELNHVTDKDFDLKTGEHWIKYSVAIKNVMEHHVARGKSWVECIDNAIRATRKIQAAIEEEDHADSGK